jgi:hypothetical protein
MAWQLGLVAATLFYHLPPRAGGCRAQNMGASAMRRARAGQVLYASCCQGLQFHWANPWKMPPPTHHNWAPIFTNLPWLQSPLHCRTHALLVPSLLLVLLLLLCSCCSLAAAAPVHVVLARQTKMLEHTCFFPHSCHAGTRAGYCHGNKNPGRASVTGGPLAGPPELRNTTAVNGRCAVVCAAMSCAVAHQGTPASVLHALLLLHHWRRRGLLCTSGSACMAEAGCRWRCRARTGGTAAPAGHLQQ